MKAKQLGGIGRLEAGRGDTVFGRRERHGRQKCSARGIDHVSFRRIRVKVIGRTPPIIRYFADLIYSLKNGVPESTRAGLPGEKTTKTCYSQWRE
jgi:hypothetical protein